MLKASNGERTLLTFTRSSETWSRIDSYLELAAAVRRWWRVVVQRFPTLKGTPRAWVIEPHKSGWAHIHMVIAAELPRHAYAWYIERWRRAVRSESARMNVRRTAPGQKIEQAAWYVAKYVTKCASELGIALLDQLGRRRVMGSTPGWKEKLTPAWPWVLVASVRDPLTAPVDLAVRLGPPPSRLGEAGRPQAPPAPVSTLAGARPAGFASLDARYRAW